MTKTSAIGAVIIKLGYGEKVYREHGQELVALNMSNMRHTAPIFTTFYPVSVIPWCTFSIRISSSVSY